MAAARSNGAIAFGHAGPSRLDSRFIRAGKANETFVTPTNHHA